MKGAIQMNELIKINTDNSDRPTVMGRDLHMALNIQTPYKQWFDRMCEYGFTENIDFCTNLCESTGGRPSVDHQLTVDMAKQICMIQRSPEGRKYREYFLEIERQWNNPEAIMARALKIADRKLLDVTAQMQQLTAKNEQLTEENEELYIKTIQQEHQIDQLQPLANYTSIILANPGLVTITQIAKDYGMSGQMMNQKLKELKVQYKQNGQWLLYAPYQGKGYTHSKTQEIIRTDGRRDVVMSTMWTQEGRLFIYNILKKNGIVPTIEQHYSPKPLF